MIWPKRVCLFAIFLMLVAGFQTANLLPALHLAHASGFTFGTTHNLSNDLETSDFPTIASSGNNVYVAWVNSTLDANPDILFTASNDNGTTFGPTINLSNNLGSSSTDEQIATAGSNVYVVWADNATGDYDVYLRASSDNGTSFGNVVNLSNALGTSTAPRLAAVGVNVYVTWQTEAAAPPGSTDIFFSASSDEAANFGTAENLSNDGTGISPEIAADGSNVYVCWQDFSAGAFDLFLKASTNNGTVFGTALNLSDNPTDPVTFAFSHHLAAVGNNVYLVWEKDTFTSSDISFTRSLDNGAPGSFANVSLTSNGASTNPRLSGLGTYVFVVWEDHSVSVASVVTFVRSNSEGASFGSVLPLSSSIGFSTNPLVATAGTSVYVAWEDSALNSDVFFVSSSNNGGGFGSEVNVSNIPGSSNAPALAAPNNATAYVVWQDDIPGDYDIFFRAGLVKGPPVQDTTPPSWPVESSLTPSNIGSTSLRLSWTAATDNVAVELYRVYQNGSLLVTLDAAIRSYDVTGLMPDTVYVFNVEAGDAADNWSTDGPATTARTSVGNTSPVLDPIADMIVNESIMLSFTATASDNDNDPLTFSLGSALVGASITSDGGFSWTPSEAQGPGPYTLTIVVSDGSLTDSKSFVVTVREVNEPPVLNAIGDRSVVKGSSLTFQASAYASDPDLPAQTLTFTLANATTGTYPYRATMTLGGTFSWIPSASQTPGTYRVRIIVSDGAGQLNYMDVNIILSEGPQQGPVFPSWALGAAIGAAAVAVAILVIWFRSRRKAGAI